MRDGPDPWAGGAARPRTALAPVRPGAALRAFAELRFRLLVRRLRGRGGIPELVARIVMLLVAVPAGLVFAGAAGLGSFQAVRAEQGLGAAAPTFALFFGVWQTWTAVGLSLSDRDTVDLRRFLPYPLPPSRVYGYGVVASVVGDPFSVFWSLLLAGAFAGAAFARPGLWLVPLALVYVCFVAATAVLVALLQELLARLLRGRRARELAIATVYVGTAFLLAWGGGGGATGVFQGLRTLGAIRWIAFPPALAVESARALYAGRLADALGWLVALVAATALAAFVAYRLALGSAMAGGEGTRGEGARTGAGWWIGGRLAPLVEKEAKYLLRHPLTSILALVVPAFAGFVAWKVAPRIPEEAGEVVRALPLLGFALYAHLATQVFWLNAFGWERGGARVYFLAPVRLSDTIAAKNLACAGLALALFAASAAALAGFGGRVPAWALAAAFALHLGVAPWFLAAGNAVSILNPRAAAYTVQRGARLPPVSGLAGMAIVSTGTAIFALPVLVAIRVEQPWLLAGAWAGLGVLGLAIYLLALPRAARLLGGRREPLLAAVAGDEE